MFNVVNVVRDPILAQLGGKLVQVGTNIGPSWPKLGQGAAKLAPSWAKLVPSWPQVGPCWPKLAQVGPSWPQVGPKLAPRWPQVGPCWFMLASSWPHDGPFPCRQGLPRRPRRLCLQGLGFPVHESSPSGVPTFHCSFGLFHPLAFNLEGCLFLMFLSGCLVMVGLSKRFIQTFHLSGSE